MKTDGVGSKSNSKSWNWIKINFFHFWFVFVFFLRTWMRESFCFLYPEKEWMFPKVKKDRIWNKEDNQATSLCVWLSVTTSNIELKGKEEVYYYLSVNEISKTLSIVETLLAFEQLRYQNF